MSRRIGDFESHHSCLFTDDNDRWKAVQTRDANADGTFVYAVKTTKIYCRPICKARLARRANVCFYSTGFEAQKAGFRACKRCKPEVQGNMPEEAAVRNIKAFIERQRTNDQKPALSLSQMARQTGLSKWHFHRVFKKCVGVTPAQFLRDQATGGQGAVQLNTPPLTDDEFGWLSPELGGLDFADFEFEVASYTDDAMGLDEGYNELEQFASEFLTLPELPDQAVQF